MSIVVVESESPTLNTSERAALLAYEKTISEGLATFYAVGNALLVIRDARLYRETHATFEAYVAQRWGMSDRHGRRLIDAAVVVTKMQELTGPIGPVPTTESQARELVGLEAEAAVEVMVATIESGSMTAASLRRAREDRAARKDELDDREDEVLDHRVDEDRDRRPTTISPKRRPLTDDMRSLAVDAMRLERKVQKLLADDRFDRNAPALARYAGDLQRLDDILVRLMVRAGVAE